MPTLTLYGEAYSCARAQKGADFVRLLDENNDILFFADGITNFAPYVLSGGEWESPLAVVAPTVSAYAVMDGGVVVLTLPGSVKAETGLQVNFKAPCDCTTTEAVRVCGVNYSVCDSLGRRVTGKGGAWAAGEVVSVVLNVEERKASALNVATFSRDELLSEETAFKLGLSGENAVPDKAFAIISGFVLGSGHTEITVVDEDGKGVGGVKIEGAVSPTGTEVTSDANGVAIVSLVSEAEVTFKSPYADIMDVEQTLSPNFSEVNRVSVVMPFAKTGDIRVYTESANVLFRKPRTVDIAVAGGGQGGKGGQGGSASGMGQPVGNGGSGGIGGASGKVYNVLGVGVTSESSYTLLVGSGGVGGKGGTPAFDSDGTWGNDGNYGTEGSNTTLTHDADGSNWNSASGSVDAVPLSDSSILVGGAGGNGGYGATSWTSGTPGTEGGNGTRAGGKGGTGGSSNYYYPGGNGAKGGPAGGGGGGGGGGSMEYYEYAASGGAGGNGGSGALVIRF